MTAFVVLAFFLFADKTPPANLEEVRAVENVNKRYERALDYADARLDQAKSAYAEASFDAFQSGLREIGEAVKLCDETLRSTGKDPRKNSKHFKRAEKRIRELMRRLDSFQNEVSYMDREPVAVVKKQIGKIHEELLFDIMGRR